MDDFSPQANKDDDVLAEEARVRDATPEQEACVGAFWWKSTPSNIPSMYIAKVMHEACIE